MVATPAEFATLSWCGHARLMTIYPGDPQDVYRRRRGLINGIQGVLLLPAQGAWLTIAISHGGFWWAVWGLVLAVLLVAVVLAVIQDRRRGLEQRPPILNVLLLTEVVALVVGVVVSAVL